MATPITVPKVQSENREINQLQANIINAMQNLAQQVQTNQTAATAPTAYYPQVEMAFCTEAQFQAVKGTNWVLIDGRNVAGSAYAKFTIYNTIPDMRATVPRMKDNGAGLDQNGDLPLGTYEGDTIQNHTHDYEIWTTLGGGALLFMVEVLFSHRVVLQEL